MPDPIEGARICENAGADGIVCHLREDRRHINDRDVRLLRKTVTTKLDLEMAATDEIIRIALVVVPELVTLVPEKRMELTTEGGLDVVAQRPSLTEAIRKFHDKGILVSLFVDPENDQVEASREVGADMVEIHTGDYANAAIPAEVHSMLRNVEAIAALGKKLGMGVNAGHGLDYVNVRPVANISAIDEMSIGHSIISRAVMVGLNQAVKEMIAAVATSVPYR